MKASKDPSYVSPGIVIKKVITAISCKDMLPIFWAFFVGLVGISLAVFRTWTLEAPVYGGDEFAYWENARLLGVDRANYPQGSFIGSATNYVFLLFLSVIQGFSQSVAILRVANIFLLVAAGALVWAIAREVLSNREALLAASFVFVCGLSVYNIAAMPEIFLMVLFLTQTFFVVRWWSPGGLVLPATIGMLSGAMILTKPHGVAITIGIASGSFLYATVFSAARGRIVLVVRDVIIALCICFFTIMSVRSLVEGALVVSPVGLSGPLYGGIASGSLKKLGLLKLARGSFWFACAHVSVLVALFAPAFFGNFFCLEQERRSMNLMSKHALLSSLVFGVFAAMLALISAFSYSIGTQNSFEANRLHVRYWSFLTPLLFVVALSSLKRQKYLQDERRRAMARRVEAFGMFAAAILLLFIFIPYMRLFPWDAPELFSLYQPRINDWNHQALLPQARWIVALCFGLAFVTTLTDKFRGGCYIFVVTLILILGNFRTTEWQLVHMEGVSPIIKQSQELAALIDRHSVGVLVTDDPWGNSSFVRFHLPAKTSLVQQPSDGKLRMSDIPKGAEWVVVSSSLDVSGLELISPEKRLSLFSLYRLN